MTPNDIPADENCVFCQIASGRIPSTKVYEDGDFLAFLDINPIAEGHFLIMTKGHYPTLADMPEGLLAKALPLAQKLAAAAGAALGTRACNLLQNNGQVAGQSVPHWHLHVIPRREPGEFPFPGGRAADLTKLPFVAEKIRAALD